MNPRKISAFVATAFASVSLSPQILIAAVIAAIVIAAFAVIATAAPAKTKPVKPISLWRLEKLYGQMKQKPVRYGYGVKAEHFAPRWNLALVNIPKITAIDCSGFVRLGAYEASLRGLIIPDGSQIQRGWAEKNLRQVRYADAAKYMTKDRLFIAFIKPWTNGCGRVGHVWFLRMRNGKPVTVESHGGIGVNSRPWNAPTLRNQVYSTYELPAVK